MSGRKQFDVDEALERSMKAFWRYGYADTSIDVLLAETGLSRGSLYGTFGGKNALFLRSLERYEITYGHQFDQALARHPDSAARAVEAMLEVVLRRIADPAVPDGCLVALAAAQTGTMKAATGERVRQSLDAQRRRVRTALRDRGIASRQASELGSFVVAVIQSLGLLSRAGAPMSELRSITRITGAAVAASRPSPPAHLDPRARAGRGTPP